MRNVISTWAQIAVHLSNQPAHSCMKIEKRRVEHPQAAGMGRSIGLPIGQFADWRMRFPNCHGLHVREFTDHYTAHIDQVNPGCDLPGHVVTDVPVVGGGAAVGALVGLILGESAGAMLVGAVIGGLVGASVAVAKETAACAVAQKPQPV